MLLLICVLISLNLGQGIGDNVNQRYRDIENEYFTRSALTREANDSQE